MMSELLVLLFMVLVHIIADFHLQGKMGEMKQKSWWAEYGWKYDCDYIVVLILHGFEWSVLVSLPLLFVTGLDVGSWFIGMIIVNGLIHSLIDHLKANRLSINLVQDQTLHMLQIYWTWRIVTFVVGL